MLQTGLETMKRVLDPSSGQTKEFLGLHETASVLLCGMPITGYKRSV